MERLSIFQSLSPHSAIGIGTSIVLVIIIMGSSKHLKSDLASYSYLLNFACLDVWKRSPVIRQGPRRDVSARRLRGVLEWS